MKRGPEVRYVTSERFLIPKKNVCIVCGVGIPFSLVSEEGKQGSKMKSWERWLNNFKC